MLWPLIEVRQRNQTPPLIDLQPDHEPRSKRIKLSSLLRGLPKIIRRTQRQNTRLNKIPRSRPPRLLRLLRPPTVKQNRDVWFSEAWVLRKVVVEAFVQRCGSCSPGRGAGFADGAWKFLTKRPVGGVDFCGADECYLEMLEGGRRWRISSNIMRFRCSFASAPMRCTERVSLLTREPGESSRTATMETGIVRVSVARRLYMRSDLASP